MELMAPLYTKKERDFVIGVAAVGWIVAVLVVVALSITLSEAKQWRTVALTNADLLDQQTFTVAAQKRELERATELNIRWRETSQECVELLRTLVRGR
jgi:hypothetical protein